MAKSIDSPVGKVTNRNTNRGPGGGLGSNKVVKKPVITGGPNQGMRPQGIGMRTGQSVDARVKEPLLTPGYSSGVRMGNELSASTAKNMGPGSNRVVHPSGGQHSLPGVSAPAKKPLGI